MLLPFTSVQSFKCQHGAWVWCGGEWWQNLNKVAGTALMAVRNNMMCTNKFDYKKCMPSICVKKMMRRRSQPNDNEWFIHHKLNCSLVIDGRRMLVRLFMTRWCMRLRERYTTWYYTRHISMMNTLYLLVFHQQSKGCLAYSTWWLSVYFSGNSFLPMTPMPCWQGNTQHALFKHAILLYIAYSTVYH
jgi:hypothetical protein